MSLFYAFFAIVNHPLIDKRILAFYFIVDLNSCSKSCRCNTILRIEIITDVSCYRYIEFLRRLASLSSDGSCRCAIFQKSRNILSSNALIFNIEIERPTSN